MTGDLLSLRFCKLAAFLDTRRLAAQIPQIVQLRTSHLALTLYLYFLYRRAVHRKYPLYSHAVRNLTHRERLIKSSMLAGYHYAIKDLYTLPLRLYSVRNPQLMPRSTLVSFV